MKRYAIRVSGRVQGVGFRYTANSIASNLNLTGWVKNMEDGSVCIEIQGDTKVLDIFINKLEKCNGFIYNISNLSCKNINTIDSKSSFKIKY
ncbi:acylphosphatase [Clostridium sp. LBM24168]